MTDNVRTAKPNEFIFKRDSHGMETVEHQGLVFAMLSGREIIIASPLNEQMQVGEVELKKSAPAMHPDIMKAVERAKAAGFWTLGRPKPTFSPVSVSVMLGLEVV